MHYFKRNIGDYHKKAGRLSMLEHGAYTLLIDSCYDRERFPTIDEAIDWCWARTDEEINAVKFVLGKFFTLSDDIYTQNRIEEEILEYQHKSLINKQIALTREQKKREGKSTTEHEPCTNEHLTKNQEPITNNHKPVTNNKNTSAIGADIFPEILDRQLVKDWITVRKGKKAAITPTAIKGFMREVEKSGLSLQDVLKRCCEKSWAGFEAGWLEKENGRVNGNRLTSQQETEEKTERIRQKLYGNNTEKEVIYD